MKTSSLEKSRNLFNYYKVDIWMLLRYNELTDFQNSTNCFLLSSALAWCSNFATAGQGEYIQHENLSCGRAVRVVGVCTRIVAPLRSPGSCLVTADRRGLASSLGLSVNVERFISEHGYAMCTRRRRWTTRLHHDHDRCPKSETKCSVD